MKRITILCRIIGVCFQRSNSVRMVVRDRLKELQEKSKYYKDGEVEELEMKPLNPKDKLNMTSFFQAAEEIALGPDFAPTAKVGQGVLRIDKDRQG